MVAIGWVGGFLCALPGGLVRLVEVGLAAQAIPLR